MFTREEIKKIAAEQISENGPCYDRRIGACKYRLGGYADDESKCAVGALINDEYYLPEFDEAGAGGVTVGDCMRDAKCGQATNMQLTLLWSLQSSGVDVHDHGELLIEMQSCHDDSIIHDRIFDGEAIADRILDL